MTKLTNLPTPSETFPSVDSSKEPLRTGTSGNMSIAMEKKAPNTLMRMVMMTIMMMRMGSGNMGMAQQKKA